MNVQKRPILPSDRRPFALKILRWVLRPDLFSDILERVNVLHFAQQQYLLELTNKMRLSYPMLSYFNILVDHRNDKVYEMNKLESQLKQCYY